MCGEILHLHSVSSKLAAFQYSSPMAHSSVTLPIRSRTSRPVRWRTNKNEREKRKAESGKFPSRVATQHTARRQYAYPTLLFRYSQLSTHFPVCRVAARLLASRNHADRTAGDDGDPHDPRHGDRRCQRSAVEAARRARTKATIVKLHTLLMERYESYKTRRVDVNQGILNQIETAFQNGDIDARQRGQVLADARLLATRELMKLEMPDRWSDVIGNSVSSLPPTTPINSFVQPLILSTRPSLTQAYLRRYRSINTADVATIQSNQGAECLYMVIMLATGDGEARTLFGQQDIGDTDGDGAPEFLDGWGNSIQLIRWPAGFVDVSELMSGNADADHDPFDPFRRDSPDAQRPNSSTHPISSVLIGPLDNNIAAYRLVPLLYSRGSDGETDLIVDTGAVVGLDPYAALYGTPNTQLGTARDIDNDGEGWHDNIHNHLLD